MSWLIKIEIALIKFYQLLAAKTGKRNCCRFYPTCSQYSIDALTKYGLIKGNIKGLGRLLRCNKFFPGGVDLA